MCNSNGHFFQRISTQPKAVLRVLGVFGVAKELQASPSPPPTPPGGGRMGDDRGRFAPTTPGCRLWIWRLHGRRANVVQRAHRQAPDRAPYHGAAADLRTGAGQKVSDIRCRGVSLEDVYYQERTAIQFEGTGIAAATAGIYSRCHRLLVVRIAE
jgi:hypothetical protein